MSQPGDTRGRQQMMARIRSALAAAPPADEAVQVPREYLVRGAYAPGAPELLALFVDRLEDYEATVHRCAPGDLSATVAEALRSRQASTVVVPAGLDPEWLSDWAGRALPDDSTRPLDVAALDGVDGVVTGCAVAVAETGTIVLDGSASCGRRAITLVPDYHLLVVRADQVVSGVPEAVARMEADRPLTMISGPSATSDIELNRVQGVHGPRNLVVVLVDAAPPGTTAVGPGDATG